MVIGAAAFSAIGGLVGLVLGLKSFPPTAWFAILEVGVPSGILGGSLGLLAGTLVKLLRR
jgi:hypothetical protein